MKREKKKENLGNPRHVARWKRREWSTRVGRSAKYPYPPWGGGGGSGKNKQVDGEAGETVRLREEIAERASGSQTCEKNIEGGRRGEDATGQWLRRIGTPPVLSK